MRINPRRRRVSARLAACLAAAFAISLAAPSRAEAPAALGDLKGDVIWVDFWASWCTPCRRSFPWLNDMQRKYGPTGLQVIGVNVDKERRVAERFLGETPAHFDIRYDPEGRLAETYDVQAMPSSFLIDRSGRILARHYGFKLADTDDYEASIEQALADTASAH